MARVSKDILQQRPLEIVNACRKLYQEMSFQEITLKEIGKETSFSRPSIYNYFETKEEIFLELLKEEYNLWNKDLEALYEKNRMTSDDLAAGLAETLSRRECLLKIQCMNLYEIEEHSRQERLTEFKISYQRTMELVDACLVQAFPDISEVDRGEFAYSFFPFIYGVYPFAHPTKKQQQAMENAEIQIRSVSIFEICNAFLKRLLKF